MKVQRTIPEIDKYTSISVANMEKLQEMYSLLVQVSAILISIPVEEHIRSMESDDVAQILESLELSLSIRTDVGLK